MANPWDNDVLVAPAKAAGNPWDADEVIGKPIAKAAPVKADTRSALRKAVDSSASLGLAETAGNLGTSMIAAPLSGLAGIGATIGRGLGLTDADPGDITRRVGSALTYQPQTKIGQDMTGIVSKPFEWLGKGADVAGSAVAESTGSPMLGAATNTALQAVPQMIGKVAGKPAAARLAATEKALATEKSANAPKDAALVAARDKGYVLPPSEGNAGPLGSFFQGLAGDIKMEYGASTKNQRVTNGLIKKELGIPEHEAISIKMLDSIRDKAGAAYEQVKKAVPVLKTSPQFLADLKNPNSNYASARKEFSNYFKNPEVEKLIEDLSKPEFSSKAAIEMQKKLRYDGNSNMKAFDKPAQQSLGEAQLNAAKAIDSLIDENLAAQAPKGVKNFQSKLSSNLNDARQKIAKTYAVEGALNDTTGNVSAKSLAKLWEKHGTLTGGLKDVAQTAQAFPKNMREVDKIGSRSEVSNLDIAKGTLLAGMKHGALGMASIAARPLVKPVLLSDWYQAMNVKPPSYQPGLGTTLPAQILNNPAYQYLAIPRPPQQQVEE